MVEEALRQGTTEEGVNEGGGDARMNHTSCVQRCRCSCCCCSCVYCFGRHRPCCCCFRCYFSTCCCFRCYCFSYCRRSSCHRHRFLSCCCTSCCYCCCCHCYSSCGCHTLNRGWPAPLGLRYLAIRPADASFVSTGTAVSLTRRRKIQGSLKLLSYGRATLSALRPARRSFIHRRLMSRNPSRTDNGWSVKTVSAAKAFTAHTRAM